MHAVVIKILVEHKLNSEYFRLNRYLDRNLHESYSTIYFLLVMGVFCFKNAYSTCFVLHDANNKITVWLVVIVYNV